MRDLNSKAWACAAFAISAAFLAGCGGGGGDGASAPAPTPAPAPAPNAAPVANAGPSQSVSSGSVVTLDGSASSDANGDPLTYSWTLTRAPGSTSTLSGATAAKPTFSADLPGTYTATLVVSDGKTNSSSSTVTITVNPANPILTVAQPFTYAVGSLEGEMFRKFSAIRVASGAGAVVQTAPLDVAALSQASYAVKHYVRADGLFDDTLMFSTDPATGWLMGHVQTVGKEGFTGVLPKDRAAAAGFVGGENGYALENGGNFYSDFAGERAADWCVDGWMRSNYHRQAALMARYRLVGLGTAGGTIPNVAGTRANTCYIVLGVPTREVDFPGDAVVRFPAPSSTVPYTTDFKGKGLSVSMTLARFQQLTASNFQVKSMKDGSLVAGKVSSNATDPLVYPNTVFFIPDAPLPESTSFEVSFTGSAPNGVTISSTWQFSTDRNRYAAGRPMGLPLIR